MNDFLAFKQRSVMCPITALFQNSYTAHLQVNLLAIALPTTVYGSLKEHPIYLYKQTFMCTCMYTDRKKCTKEGHFICFL